MSYTINEDSRQINILQRIVLLTFQISFVIVFQDAGIGRCSAQDLGEVKKIEVNVIGPDDQISVTARDVEELTGRVGRVDHSGSLTFPIVGRIQVAGLTTEQVEQEISRKLQPYVKQPEVSVVVTEYQSRPLSILGAVNHPGIQQVYTDRTIQETLSAAGGLTPDAGGRIVIVRQKEWGYLPVSGAKISETGQSTAEIKVENLLQARDPGLNIKVKPHDVITVPPAKLIYVLGEVGRAGGFPLKDGETISVLQALALAQGLNRSAAPQHARILQQGNAQAERPVPLNRILKGTAPDQNLSANDILFVPDNVPKSAALRAMEAAIQVGTGVVIFRR